MKNPTNKQKNTTQKPAESWQGLIKSNKYHWKHENPAQTQLALRKSHWQLKCLLGTKLYFSGYSLQVIKMKKLSKIGVTEGRSAISSSCLGSVRDSKQCESSHGLDKLNCLFENRVFPWTFTEGDTGSQLYRRNLGFHLGFSVRYDVSHDTSCFVPLCSSYTEEEVFRLRSAESWSPQKATKEGSFIHSSGQTTRVKRINKLLSSLRNFCCP